MVPWPLEEVYDAGLRFDLLANLLADLPANVLADLPAGAEPEASCWTTRPGAPHLHDADLEWFASATSVFAALQVELLTFRVVTRTGWLDVATGANRTWRRLRL